MHGDPIILARHAVTHIEHAGVREAARSTIEFILLTQSVVLNRSGRTFAVAQGSSMGQVISAAVAGVNFYETVEKDVSRNAECMGYGLLRYIRYRDDILAVFDCNAQKDGRLGEFVSSVVRAAKPTYEVTIDEVTLNACDYLDVTFMVVNGSIEYKLFRKATSQNRPLSTTSGHPPRVHLAWPVAEVSRIFKRCSMRSDFVKERFSRLLRHHFVLDSIVDNVENHEPSANPKAVKLSPKVAWMVMPYHPAVYQAGLMRTIRAVMVQWERVHNLPFEVIISWKMEDLNLLAYCRKLFRV